MEGMLAVSKAGHDKQNIYIILKDDGEYVYLADGTKRRADSPKKKKKKHIQPIKIHPDLQLSERLLRKEAVRDEEIKRAIKNYKRADRI